MGMQPSSVTEKTTKTPHQPTTLSSNSNKRTPHPFTSKLTGQCTNGNKGHSFGKGFQIRGTTNRGCVRKLDSSKTIPLDLSTTKTAPRHRRTRLFRLTIPHPYPP